MSQHTVHPVFDGFQTLWVFNSRKQFPLGNNELLVYSALAHADAREHRLTNKDLAWRTGLSRNAIPRILQSLFVEKFILEDRSPVDRSKYFLTADRKKMPTHWSQSIRFWKCLVRCEGSKLLVSDQCVLSYVWWSQVTGFNPPTGWSVPYLSSILKLNKKTVRAAINRLTNMCLLKVSDKQWFVPKSLSPLQEAWFVRKDLDVSVKEKITLGEFDVDIRELADGYLPGNIIGVTDPVSSRRPVDSSAVHRLIGEVLNGVRCDMKTRMRLFDSAKPELGLIGTDGDDWKPIVERHVQKWITEQQASEATVSESANAFIDMGDMSSLMELHAANLT